MLGTDGFRGPSSLGVSHYSSLVELYSPRRCGRRCYNLTRLLLLFFFFSRATLREREREKVIQSSCTLATHARRHPRLHSRTNCSTKSRARCAKLRSCFVLRQPIPEKKKNLIQPKKPKKNEPDLIGVSATPLLLSADGALGKPSSSSG